MTDTPRKIIHIDMDAFFASVEQRDRPELRGVPVVVGGRPTGRGVVAAASYEARRFGVRSAMPSARAQRLCPDLVFVRARFTVYRRESERIRAILAEYSARIEPLSIDEAFLDVTSSTGFRGSATRVAEAIRRRIRDEIGLTASAGVATNKFLAKLASDVNKPDGQFVIAPGEEASFVTGLDIARFHGIGPATAGRMRELGIHTGADLRAWSESDLRARFGRVGTHYHQLARGIDDRPVTRERRRKSVGQETTFAEDVYERTEMEGALQALADRVMQRLQSLDLRARTLTVKARFDDFTLCTRSQTGEPGFATPEDAERVLPDLLRRAVPPGRAVRLLGVTASNLEARDELQGELWEES